MTHTSGQYITLGSTSHWAVQVSKGQYIHTFASSMQHALLSQENVGKKMTIAGSRSGTAGGVQQGLNQAGQPTR
jgi:hypothetical protein